MSDFDDEYDEDLLHDVPTSSFGDGVLFNALDAMEPSEFATSLDEAHAGNDVARALDFTPSQPQAPVSSSPGTLEPSCNHSSEDRLQMLPPLDFESIMIRGDNGVCRWSVVPDAGDDAFEAYNRKAEERRTASPSCGVINIHQLLSEVHEIKAAKVHAATAEDFTPAIVNRRVDNASGEDLWVTKYRPRGFKELLSDENANLSIVQWVNSWRAHVLRSQKGAAPGRRVSKASTKGPRQQSDPFADLSQTASAELRPDDRLLLIVGPPGVGKTTLAHVIAAHCGYEAREINASSDRTASVIDAIISDAVRDSVVVGDLTVGKAAQLQSKDGANDPLAALLKPKCLIIDEMDGIHANVVSLLLKKDIHRPVMCLANNLFAPALRELRSSGITRVVQVPPITPARLVGRLEFIVAREAMEVDRATLSDLVHTSNGDIRCCLNTLQFLRRAPGSLVSASEVQKAMAQLRGKDSMMGLWPLWAEVFTRKDKAKYVSLLKSEFHIDWANHQQSIVVDEELPSEIARKRSRVDPGYVYVTRKMALCADNDALLDGLFQHYTQQKYNDYTFEKTRRCADVFAFQDTIATHGFQNNNVGMADRYVQVTGGACFSLVSSMNRGQPLSYPKEGQNFRERFSKSVECAHMFRDRLRGLTAAAYCSPESISSELAPFLLRCLLDSLIRIPKHSVASQRAFGPVDRKLFQQGVEKHVEYGLTYVEGDRTLKGRRPWGQFRHGGPQQSQSADESGWMLQPSIHELGCVIAQHRAEQPTVGKPLVLQLRDEIKQLLAGEAKTESIRIRQEHFKVPQTQAGANRTPPVAEAGQQSNATTAAMSTVSAVAAPPTPQKQPLVHKQDTPGKARPVKRDFFGRPINSTAPVPKSSTATAQPSAASTKLPPTHPVKYLYFDGSTNAVKIPASIADF